MADRLIVRGAREHNLKDVSLDLPRDSLIVFTGLSGSGKSSLAFDTIFAEGQRRYVESLSAYARQFLGQMDKPDVDFIEGLSPAVSIDQKSTSRNPRSTVGTITEVYDYLRLLWARIGKPHCPQCGRTIARQSPEQIVDRVMELAEGTRFQVLAPVIRGRKGEYAELFSQLQAKGFARARVDGTVVRLDEPPTLKKQEKHDIEVIVDRLAVKEGARSRLTGSVETALQLSGGTITLEFVDLPDNDPNRERFYSEHLYCPYDDLSFEEMEPRSFSFNSPFGACPECTGLGVRMEVDPDLIVPDPEKTLGDGAISPWAGGHTSDYFVRLVEALGLAMGFKLTTPWEKLPRKAQNALLHGHDEQVHVRYSNRYGRERSYYTTFEGADPLGCSAVMPSPRATACGRSTKATCGRSRARPARGPGSSRSRWPSRWRTARSPTSRRCRSASARRSWPGSSCPTGTCRSPSGWSRRSTPGWASCWTSVSTT